MAATMGDVWADPGPDDTDDVARGAAELDAPGTHHQKIEHRPLRRIAEQSAEERAYNRRLYGLTYNERYGQPEGTCVNYCRHPGQRRRGARCSSCYGHVEIRSFADAPEDVAPGPMRAERFAAWCGGWVGAFLDAMLFPFRLGADHTRAMVRNALQEALQSGLNAEIVRRCPTCNQEEV